MKCCHSRFHQNVQKDPGASGDKREMKQGNKEIKSILREK
jgi:hypothetical protein